MIKVYYSKHFWHSAQRLSPKQQEKLADLLELFKENPFHPKLHTKPLAGRLSGTYSFRITRDWRVLFRFLSPEEIFVAEIGHRSKIYH